MPMSRCEDVIGRISAILDDELGPVARLRFHAHLAMCASCRNYYQQMLTVKSAAGQVSPDDMPGDFENVMGFVLDHLDDPPAHDDPGTEG